ncbi:MAG: exo-alpha-sialidase [Methylobacter sp.]|nr:exo-alpha-sialidase [Methylobacter sp.]
MIDSPDFPLTTQVVRFHNRTSLKISVGQLLGRLLLISALTLIACSHDNQGYLKAGTSDYSHYPAGGGLFVTAAFGPDGRLWRVVPEKQHVYVDYSTDLGKTFSAPVLINTKAQHIKVSGESRPGIVVDSSGRITVIYAAKDAQPVTVYFSVSADNGRSFSTPSPLSDKAAEANSFQGRLALSPSGQAYVFWHDERDQTDPRPHGNAIYYTTLDDRGLLNFSARKLSDSACDCCRVAVAFDTDVQPVLFTRFIYPGGIRDHGLIKIQTDDNEPLASRATFDDWKIEACPDHGPAIAISDNNYHIAWFTQGNKRQGLFYAYSSDRGQHFSQPLPFGNPDKLPSHPNLMAKGKHIMLTWIEFDGSNTQLLLMQSNDGGRTWLPAKTIAASTDEVDFPFLLSNNNGVFISWNSKNEGYRLLPVN